MSSCRGVLKSAGICVIAGGPKNGWKILIRSLQALVSSPFVRPKMVLFIARINSADLAIMGELMQAGKVKPVIDRRYKLSEIPDAFRYAAEGHARGKVIIALEDNNKT